MSVVKRGEVAAPVLPKETVEVEALKGDVVVRGLLLTESLDVQARISKSRAPESPESVHMIVPVVLALCVLDADGQPLWSEAQWQAFGTTSSNQAIALFNVAWRLSGNGGDEAKN